MREASTKQEPPLPFSLEEKERLAVLPVSLAELGGVVPPANLGLATQVFWHTESLRAAFFVRDPQWIMRL